MLILTRKEGEVIAIGDDITISVTRVQGGQVRIGINAPRSVEVLREEMWECIDAPPA